ncbi:MAG: hypothetical protein H0U23_16045 [Blastocatellia bacterium]|nr:hypothetical protein [Blastocatellia bacterium]
MGHPWRGKAAEPHPNFPARHEKPHEIALEKIGNGCDNFAIAPARHLHRVEEVCKTGGWLSRLVMPHFKYDDIASAFIPRTNRCAEEVFFRDPINEG